MKKSSLEKTVISVKPSYKHRVPHKSTRRHRDKTKYTRKGRQRDQRQVELNHEITEK